MKILLVPIILFFSTTLLAQKIIYHCDMNVVYRLDFDSDWSNKNKVMTFTISNKKIKIYDHSIKLTYSTELNVFFKQDQIIAYYNDLNQFETFAIDIQSGQGTYSISWYDGTGVGEYMTGICHNQ